jgi:hypothetical protein
MKTVSIIISLVFVFMFSFLSGTSHATPMSTSDLWDVSQGATVTSDSGILQHDYSFDVRDMFGGTFGTTEVGNTIFSYDSNTTDSLHFVEWQTASPITLQSFNLVSAHDGDANGRGFSKFTLLAKPGSSWVELYEYSPTNPYGGGVNYLGSNYLELNAGVPETTAQAFRAEFIQYGRQHIDRPEIDGPRIVELDGYGEVIPEPATLCLFGIGLLGLAGFRKKRA